VRKLLGLDVEFRRLMLRTDRVVSDSLMSPRARLLYPETPDPGVGKLYRVTMNCGDETAIHAAGKNARVFQPSSGEQQCC